MSFEYSLVKKVISHNNYLLIVSPFFFKYIITKIEEKTLDAFVKIRIKSKQNTGLSKLATLEKSNLIQNIRSNLEDLSTNNISDNMIKFFARKFVLGQIKKAAKAFYKMSRLVNLVKITYMNSKTVQKRLNIELIQKWRFIAILKKTTKIKMRSLYKNVNQIYNNVAKLIKS